MKIIISPRKIGIFPVWALLLFAPLAQVRLEPPPLKIKQQPKALFQQKADVVVEWQEIMDDCSDIQLCVQGNLVNAGGKPAVNVKLRVDIGNTALAKPRVTKVIKLPQTTMAPGDRQEFAFTLDRKTPYKDSKGKPKLIEVGKYNFKVVPVWTGKKP